MDPGDLTTAHLADACMRAGVDLRTGPPGLRPLVPGSRAAGPARPVRHYGSVDVFLEAIEASTPGDVLVIDNGGRTDEACIGDLIAVEAQAAGLAGLVVWGLHRDSAEIRRLGLPVVSLGATPAGPTRLDPRDADPFASARLGAATALPGDWVAADDDGAVLIPGDRLDEVVALAAEIRATEHRQAAAVAAGRSLRDQLDFAVYLERAAADPSYTLRRHLEERGGAIEV